MRRRRFRARDGWITFEDGLEVIDDAAMPYTHSGLTTDEIRAILNVRLPAIDRCLALNAVSFQQARRLVGRKHAENMRRVARQLDATLTSSVRDLGVPLRELFLVASGRNGATQVSLLLKRDAIGVNKKSEAA